MKPEDLHGVPCLGVSESSLVDLMLVTWKLTFLNLLSHWCIKAMERRLENIGTMVLRKNMVL
jgi:hypothetical protein